MREIKFRAWDGSKYDTGSDGSVWSNDFNNSGKRKQLKTYKDRDGYRVVWFTIDGKRSIHAVRRLVARTFLGECPTGLVINHKDGVRDNDRADNLEYITSRANTLHGWRVNGRKQSAKQIETRRMMSKGERNPRAKITWQQVEWIRNDRKKGLMLKQIAPKFGISIAQVGAICTNRNWI